MSRCLWWCLGLLETTASAWLIWPLIVFVAKIAHTRRDILVSNEWYFAGMFLGYSLRLIPVALLVLHSIWIFRWTMRRQKISN